MISLDPGHVRDSSNVHLSGCFEHGWLLSVSYLGGSPSMNPSRMPPSLTRRARGAAIKEGVIIG